MRPHPHTTVEGSSISYCVQVFSYWLLRRPTAGFASVPRGVVSSKLAFLSTPHGVCRHLHSTSEQCVWTRMYYYSRLGGNFLFLFNKNDLQ